MIRCLAMYNIYCGYGHKAYGFRYEDDSSYNQLSSILDFSDIWSRSTSKKRLSLLAVTMCFIHYQYGNHANYFQHLQESVHGGKFLTPLRAYVFSVRSYSICSYCTYRNFPKTPRSQPNLLLVSTLCKKLRTWKQAVVLEQLEGTEQEATEHRPEMNRGG